MAIFANSSDIEDLGFLNRPESVNVNPLITPEMLKAAVYWAWNLTVDRIAFTKEATTLCLEEATRLSKVFGFAVDIPLIIPSDARKTIARLSTAFAAISLSSEDEFQTLIVKQVHVRMTIGFLEYIYSRPNCALDGYSEIQRLGSQLTDYDKIEEVFVKKKDHEKYAGKKSAEKNTFTKAIYLIFINEYIRREDLSEQVGCSVETVKIYIKLLKRFNLIESGKYGYNKKPKFNKFLQRFMRTHPDFLITEDDDDLDSQNDGSFDYANGSEPDPFEVS